MLARRVILHQSSFIIHTSSFILRTFLSDTLIELFSRKGQKKWYYAVMNDDLLFLLTSPTAEESPSALRIKDLRKTLERHNELYYVRAAPEISDTDYDTLMAELIELEKGHPELQTPDSPSVRVGGRSLEEFTPYEHLMPMQSIDNTYDRQEVVAFDTMLKKLLEIDSIEYVVEPKIDGLAFAVHYVEGILTSAATRGDGEVGDNITENVRTIRNVPLRIDTQAAFFEARGEIYMPKSGFLMLTEAQIARDEEPFKNPRNAAAGSIKLLNPKEVAKRRLNALVYGLGRVDGIAEPKTHIALTKQLRSLGLPGQPKTWFCKNIDEVLVAIDELETMRHDFDFEIDGAVIKVNDRSLYKCLGSTAKAPRWVRAYKYVPDQAETEIEAITVQVGRTGVLTPVAELRTVRLSGSDISRATLHNEDEIRRKDIRIGDHVMIEKAGEVIPAIVSVLKEKRTGIEIEFQMPSHCPECNGPTSRKPGEVAVRCTNLLCPAQRAARLLHFAARNALDIEGLGDRVAQALVDQNLVTNPIDLFDLSEQLLSALEFEPTENKSRNEQTKTEEESQQMPLLNNTPSSGNPKRRTLGALNARTILAAVHRSKELSLSRWIAALGIPGVGSTVADDIAKLHDDFNAFAESNPIADTKRLYDLMDEAELNNPNTQRVKAMDIASRVACADKFTTLSDEVESLGTKLIEQELASRGKGSNSKFSCVIKPEACRALDNFLQSDPGRDVIRRMKLHSINPIGGNSRKPRFKSSMLAPSLFDESPKDIDSFFNGKNIVITGSFHDGLGRSEVADLIADAGGRVTESVSEKTDYLIVGEKPGASKINKAKKLGTQTMDETMLREKLRLPLHAAQSTLC